MCQEVVKIKKREPGSFYFEITVEAMTFEGAHNPPYYLVNATFSNYAGNWEETNFAAKKMERIEGRKCRKPVQYPLEINILN